MKITVSEHISDTEYSSIVDACGRYEELAERTIFSVMVRNYHHLLDLRDLFTNLKDFDGAFRDVNQRHLTVTFMNEMLNWLVSTRFYLETNRSFVADNYGPDSQQLEEHVRATNEAFDRFPGYRFMYKLRDFAQHGGVPLSGLSIQRSSNGEMELVPPPDTASTLVVPLQLECARAKDDNRFRRNYSYYPPCGRGYGRPRTD